MLLLLAQLVAPPLQRGPARLPEPAPRQQQQPRTPVDNRNDDLKLILESDSQTQPKQLKSQPRSRSNLMPPISGDLPYGTTQLETLLQGCATSRDVEAGLKRCAELLTGQLQLDGYVNSRVYIETAPAPGRLIPPGGRCNSTTPGLRRVRGPHRY